MKPTIRHLASVAALLVPLTMRGAPMQINNNGLDAMGITLVDSTDPNFFKLMPQASKTASISATALPSALGALLAYSVLVHNSSKRPIAGVVVFYAFNGQPPNTLGGAQLLWTKYADDPKMLQPGTTRLFTPSHGLAQQINWGMLSLPLSSNQQASIARDLSYYQNASSVAVYLDSVVFSNGEMVGPDVYGLMNQWNQHNQADSEVFNAILTLSGSALQSALTAMSQAKPAQPETTPETRDWHAWELRTLASSYLQYISNAGEAAAKQLAQTDATRPRIQTWRAQ